MFDWIPIQSYTSIYYYICLFFVIIIYVHTQTVHLTNRHKLSILNRWGYIFLFFVIIYMGLRPIHEIFVDMTGYAKTFELFQIGLGNLEFRDPLYTIFVSFLSKFINIETFFLLCAFLYIFPLYVTCKTLFKEYWFYAFFLFTISFSFWGYGVNGIRNGIAGSIFLLGLSRDKRLWQVVLIIISIGFHKTMILPAAGFIIANLINKPKLFILFWFSTIFLSLIGGSLWESLFANIGINDERLSYFTTQVDTEKFSRTGFRWDFLLYSSLSILIGWYFIVKKKYKDKFYNFVYITYVFSNAFWILVIRANFSNRFAYLSWFMMALVVIYPLLKNIFFKKQHKFIGYFILIYFAFTFIMNVVLSYE